ncbi:MAG: ADP-ribosylglycohydrolase family protein [Candidatus Kapaibacterium sp.]|nr:MAG: ADP-ribosylglycohydrolase family protein [Candidatus Kapabacteria bacterium]
MAKRNEMKRAEPNQRQYQGALLGLAVGDALGAPVKFRTKGAEAPVKDMTDGGPLRVQLGEWTDETATALCLAASLIENNAFDPQDQLDRYSRWRRNGYLSATGQAIDISATMKGALEKFESTGEPYCGGTSREWADNDAISRIAPVPMLWLNSPKEAMEMARESAKTTHGAKDALDAAAYMTGIMIGVLRGDPKDKIVSDFYSPFSDDWDEYSFGDEVAKIVNGSFRKDIPHNIVGDGFAPDTLEAALWAFYRSNDFETGAILAINLGGDSDSTGAVYGQIAGAYYGVQAIPMRWREKIMKRDVIVAIADKLWNLAKAR